MDFGRLKEANPWWDDLHWSEKDFHLINLRKQKIRWNYKIIDIFNNGIYSLRGPRQVGKTSWIKQKIEELAKKIIPKNILFYSCDNINKAELEELMNLFFDFSQNGKKFIFLDEIPFVKEWEIVIKHLYDSGKMKNCFVLVCGSSSIDISRSVEKLPGRGDQGKRHFVMYPLSFKEYLEAIDVKIDLTKIKEKDEAILKINFKSVSKIFQDYLLTGGFLKIINEYHSNGSISDASYDVYLKWIIGDLAKLNLKENFVKQILRRVLETYTNEVSWANIHSGTDIDTHNTTSKYVISLEEMFVLNIIYKMEFNKKIPDYPKSKKIYFFNPFILSCIFKWISSYEDNFNRYRAYLEKIEAGVCEGVFLNHLASYLTNNSNSDIFHYSDIIFYWTNKTKTKEVDFVYNNIGFEVKYQNRINSEDYKGISEFKRGFLLTKKDFGDRTYPLSVFLLIFDRFLK